MRTGVQAEVKRDAFYRRIITSNTSFSTLRDAPFNNVRQPPAQGCPVQIRVPHAGMNTVYPYGPNNVLPTLRIPSTDFGVIARTSVLTKSTIAV